jgi:hypothetical protein
MFEFSKLMGRRNVMAPNVVLRAMARVPAANMPPNTMNTMGRKCSCFSFSFLYLLDASVGSSSRYEISKHEFARLSE